MVLQMGLVRRRAGAGLVFGSFSQSFYIVVKISNNLTHGAHSVQGKSSTQGARRRPIVSAHRRTRQGDVVKVDPYVVALGTDVVDEQHHVEEVREENNTSKPKLKSNTSHSLK
ncbi:hypothetical protein DEO72_LG6g1601 [Vigna unguiculata]|uniref:Uncharacterized protein n=1 Tax=Vigna unguiculata TaxID=3917 RepID=A0A4D6M916_VIGUN|nr:hypothetical protein DEO72_LG6g1601 [Vigna unguiculata]